MKLTAFQLKTLRAFNRFRNQSSTLGRLIALNWSTCLRLVIIGAVGYAVTLVLLPVAGWIIIGIAAGSLCRDIARFRGTVRSWAVYKEIINWQKVTDLMDECDKPNA
jgi:hypothetical protein